MCVHSHETVHFQIMFSYNKLSKKIYLNSKYGTANGLVIHKSAIFKVLRSCRAPLTG
jgi:hypothetical protein